MSDEEILRLSELEVNDEGHRPASAKVPRYHGSSVVDQEARDDALRAELAGVQQINKVIEGVVASLERAKENMEAVSAAVNSSNKLLNLWIRILSQTEHTQRLLLDGNWEGATKDLQDIEAEAIAKAQAKERRKEEERERRAAREREAAAEEARRASSEKKPARGRGKGAASGSGSTRGSRIGSGASAGGTGSNIGRGIPRGRSTGSGVGRGTGRGTGRGRGVK